MAALRFCFDFISPYAYLGWRSIHDLAERCGATVEPVPVLFAALLNAHGNKGPAEIPSKRIYIFKHTLRVAHDLGVPLAPPPTHPFNPLLALRVASLPRPAKERRLLIDALFDAVWAGGDGAETVAQVADVLTRLDLDPEQELRAATQPENKARLRTQTEAALAAGVFGVPTVLVGDELFWGQDAFPHVEAYVKGRDPVATDALERWSATPASAQR